MAEIPGYVGVLEEMELRAKQERDGTVLAILNLLEGMRYGAAWMTLCEASARIYESQFLRGGDLFPPDPNAPVPIGISPYCVTQTYFCAACGESMLNVPMRQLASGEWVHTERCPKFQEPKTEVR